MTSSTRPSLKLSGINLENLNQLNVEPSTEFRNYGRRFTVKMGDDTVEVVLKDLFKKTQKLAKSAHTKDELNDVSRFINVIIAAEKSAKKNYKERDCLYKFRSWFHRLFGGAFLGSHLDRLNKLQTKVASKSQNYEMEHLGIGLDFFGKFLEDNEKFLQSIAVLANQTKNGQVLTLDINDKEFHVWKEENSLNIQETSDRETISNLLEINLIDHSIMFEKNNVENIPEASKNIFSEIVCNAYRKTSEYSKEQVRLIREGIDYIPEWHLNECSKFIEQNDEVSLDVHFLRVGEDKIEEEKGTDSGGLRRDYINDLVGAVQNLDYLFGRADGSLKIPRIVRNQEDALFTCNQAEAATYQNLGRLLCYCFKSIAKHTLREGSNKYFLTTGLFFTDAMFKAAFSLSKADLKRPFKDQIDLHGRMAKIILTHLDKQSSNTVDNVIKCLELLEEGKLEEANKDLLNMAIILMGESGEVYQDQEGNPDSDILGKKDLFKHDLYQAILKDTTLVSELNGISIGSMLDPIFHMAVGMNKTFPGWDNIQSDGAEKISVTIQGTIDRNKIIESIIPHLFSTTPSPDFYKKIDWLKEWILEAQDDEIKKFLKFLTGCTSILENENLKIYCQMKHQLSPYPAVASCGLAIFISDKMSYSNWSDDHWDNTKDHFIRNLTSAMTTTGYQNDLPLGDQLKEMFAFAVKTNSTQGALPKG